MGSTEAPKVIVFCGRIWIAKDLEIHLSSVPSLITTIKRLAFRYPRVIGGVFGTAAQPACVIKEASAKASLKTEALTKCTKPPRLVRMGIAKFARV